MIATPRREIAALLYDKIVELRPDWHSDSDNAGRIKVVTSESERGRGSELLRLHLRDRHGLKTIERRFKDPDDELELVILVDMWLTGFDVPPAHTLYLYKPMRGHTLMQAIARVNRVWGEKPAGLIVDYVGVGEDLKKAVGEYGGYPAMRLAAPVEERLRALEEEFDVVRTLLPRLSSTTAFFEAQSDAGKAGADTHRGRRSRARSRRRTAPIPRTPWRSSTRQRG